MKISNAVYKRNFKILLSVFLILVIVEFVFSLLGVQLGDVYIAGLDLDQDNVPTYFLKSVISSLTISAFVNFFLIISLVKKRLGFSSWPAPAVVFMTILIPLEILICMILVIPNIIFFGINGMKPQNTRIF